MTERRTTARRAGDPKPTKPRTVQLCDEDRLLMQEIMEKIGGDQYGGLTEAQHTAQHATYGELLPWLVAMREEQQRRAEFWRKLINDNIIKAVGILLLAGALAMFFGWSKSISWLISRG